MKLCSQIILTFCRRNALFIFISIKITIQSQINITKFHFFQIDMTCRIFISRNFFKYKWLKEFA